MPGQISKDNINLNATTPNFVCGTADTAAFGAVTLPIFNLFAAQANVLIKSNSSGSK